MCQLCILINKSLPSPRTLVNAQREFDIDNKHFEEVINLALDKVEDNEIEYFQDLVNEIHLDRLRNT